jgi:hypothetical protein
LLAHRWAIVTALPLLVLFCVLVLRAILLLAPVQLPRTVRRSDQSEENAGDHFWFHSAEFSLHTALRIDAPINVVPAAQNRPIFKIIS